MTALVAQLWRAEGRRGHRRIRPRHRRRVPIARGARVSRRGNAVRVTAGGPRDAAWTSTAAPNLPDDAVVLSDRTSLIRAENVVPLYRRNELSEQQVLALNQIAGELDTGALADMRRQVAEGKEPGAVAGAWLDAHPLGH